MFDYSHFPILVLFPVSIEDVPAKQKTTKIADNVRLCFIVKRSDHTDGLERTDVVQVPESVTKASKLKKGVSKTVANDNHWRSLKTGQCCVIL